MHVEMLIIWSGNTWTDGHYVEIPDDTPEADMQEVAEQAILKNLSDEDDAYMACMVYHIDADPFDDEN